MLSKIIFVIITWFILIFPVCNILITLFAAIPLTNELYKEFPNDFDKNASHKMSAVTIILNLIILGIITGIVFFFFSKYLTLYYIMLAVVSVFTLFRSGKTTANRTDFIKSRLRFMSSDLQKQFENSINVIQSETK